LAQFLKTVRHLFGVFRQSHVHCLLPYSVITGGPLTDKYQLAVIRFHWGQDDSSGSEHSIDDQNYPLEVTRNTWLSERKRPVTAPPLWGVHSFWQYKLLCTGSTHSLEQRPIQKYRTGDGWRKRFVYYWNLLSGKSKFFIKNWFIKVFHQFCGTTCCRQVKGVNLVNAADYISGTDYFYVKSLNQYRRLCVCMSVYLSVCLSIYLSVYIRPFVRLFLWLSAYLSVCGSVVPPVDLWDFDSLFVSYRLLLFVSCLIQL